MRALAVLALVALVGVASAAVARDDGALLAVPLTIHVAGGALDAEQTALLDGAIDAYSPHAICFVVALRDLSAEHVVLDDIRERRSLRSLLVERAANAFLVDRALDPHPSAATVRAAARIGFTPTGLLGGAHIPAPGHRPATYVFVTRDSSRFSLAHELGHLLGANHHRDPTNIMSYGAHRDHFDEEQVRTFRGRARRYLTRHELSRVDAADCNRASPTAPRDEAMDR